MSKKILVPSIFILAAAILIGVAVISTKIKQIPDNPPSTIGNTAGNLNNGGLFCESDGVIYFANTNDNNYLYRMDSDGSNIALLADIPVSYINAGGDYIYVYYNDTGDVKFMGFTGNMRGIYRCKKNGKDDLFCLDRCTCGIINLIGSTLYYQHYDKSEGMTLYSSSLDGKNKGMAVNALINPASVYYGNIYYCDEMSSLNLCSYTPGAKNGSTVLEKRMYNPTIEGDYIYYMNVDDKYRLYRYDISTNEHVKITDDRIDTFNVYGNAIFYQRNKKPALIRVNVDGSNPMIIAEGVYCNINCTSNYTFFSPFDDKTKTYYTYTDEPGGYSTFITD